MIPQTGQHIKCIFRNGTVIEGIVEEWVTGQVQLQSLTDQSIMIIMHPEEDILLIKIMQEVSSEIEKPVPAESVPVMQEQIKSKLDQVTQAEKPELQQKNLKELRKMVVEQERQNIARKIRIHFPSAYMPHKPNYGSQIDLLPPARKKS